MFSAINYLCVSFSFLADTLNIIVDYNNIHKWVYQVGMQPIPLETQVLITLWYFLIPNATDLLLDDLGFVNPVMKMIDDVVDTVLQDQKRFILWPICNLTFQTFTFLLNSLKSQRLYHRINEYFSS